MIFPAREAVLARPHGLEIERSPKTPALKREVTEIRQRTYETEY
jgi:hypothetical protein